MKRRDVVTLFGTSITLGAFAPKVFAFGSAETPPQSPALYAIYEPKLGGCEDVARVAGATTEGVCAQRSPVLIGLGPKAAVVLEQLKTGGMLPAGAGLYSNVPQPGPTVSSSSLHTLMGNSGIAILLIDGTSTQALSDALHWARTISIHKEIDLRTAVCLEGDVPATTVELKAALDHYLDGVFVITTERTSHDNLFAATVFLEGLLQHRQMITISAEEVREQLLQSHGYAQCCSIDIRTDMSAPLSEMVRTAITAMQPAQNSRLLAWLHAGQGLSIGDFERVGTALKQYLPSNCPMVLSIVFRHDWSDPDRKVLNLALSSDNIGNYPPPVIARTPGT